VSAFKGRLGTAGLEASQPTQTKSYPQLIHRLWIVGQVALPHY